MLTILDCAVNSIDRAAVVALHNRATRSEILRFEGIDKFEVILHNAADDYASVRKFGVHDFDHVEDVVGLLHRVIAGPVEQVIVVLSVSFGVSGCVDKLVAFDEAFTCLSQSAHFCVVFFVEKLDHESNNAELKSH